MNKTSMIITSLLACIAMSCAPQAEKIDSGKSVKETVVDNIMSRRSIRKYKAVPVDSNAMREILLCGINAPNGQGRESWEIRVVTDAGFIREIDSVYKEYAVTVLKQERPARHVAYGAPALVFIAYDTTYDLSQVDCGLLGGNMMLAANSMRIGSCCLGGLCRFVNEDAGSGILERLELPSTHRLLYAIAFGYPEVIPAAKPRNSNKIKFIPATR